ncbi:MAG: signal peptide peptidase SppA [Candidatus Thermochlorobacter sp.]
MAEQTAKRGSRRILIIILILLGLLGALTFVRALQPKSEIPKEAVLMMSISGALPERVFVDAPAFGSQKPISTFQGALRTLNRAKDDNRIQLIVLEISALSAPFSKLAELRDAIAAVRQSGKEVWAYLSGGSDKEYYLASACNKIYLEPYSVYFIDGLSFESLYFKTALEKLGVEVEAIRRGKYKSAVEPFISDSQSDADREQDEALLNAFDKAYIDAICTGRNLSESDVRRLINDVAFFSEKQCVEFKLADSVVYMTALKEQLKAKFSAKSNQDIFVSQRTFEAATEKQKGEKIAVVYVQGTIVDGKGSQQPDGQDNVGDKVIEKALERVRKDNTIKAVILRVDSPGGSVTASDKMGQAILKVKAEKPVVVSMSGVAASGGYWISVDANKILAHPLTITGSIGIFAIKPNIKKLQEEIGLKRQVLLRGKFADALNAFEKLSPEAYQKVDTLINEGYQRFLARVAEGRKMTVSDVDSIAQGRVWIGESAQKIGLVDELGGFNRAVEVAKDLAKLDASASVVLVEYPQRISFFDVLFGTDDEDEDNVLARVWHYMQAHAKSQLLSEIFGQSELADELQRLSRTLEYVLSATLKPLAQLPREIIIN